MTVETAPQSKSDAPAPKDAKKPLVKLGEELPIFCERCGYSLHGLPQSRCDRCTILHFVCPECNHHQPINTIRPAFQRILGRTRAFVLLIVILFKLNFFFWCLFGWGAFGYEWSYEYNYRSVRQVAADGTVLANHQRSTYAPRRIDELFAEEEALIAITLTALGFGIVARMFVLRWRRGFFVGAVLAGLVVLALVLGALFRQYERRIESSPFIWDFWVVAAFSAACVIAGASIAWPIWSGLVRLVMPRETALAFLDWQRNLTRRDGALARE